MGLFKKLLGTKKNGATENIKAEKQRMLRDVPIQKITPANKQRVLRDVPIQKIALENIQFSLDGGSLVVSGTKVSTSPRGGQRISISVSTSGGIVILDTESFQFKKEIAQGSLPGAVAFAKDGTMVYGVINSSLSSWDAVTGTKLKTFHEKVEAASFSPDRTQVLISTNDGQLWGIDLANDLKQGPFANSGEKSRLLCAGSGEFYAVQAKGDTIVMKNLARNDETCLAGWSGGQLSAIQLSTNGTHLAAGSSSGTIGVFDLSRRQKLLDSNIGKERIKAIAFSPDGSFLVYGGADCGIYFLRIALMEVQACFGDHPFPIAAVAIHPDNMHVLSAGLDGTVKQWEVTVPAREVPEANAFGVAPSGKPAAMEPAAQEINSTAASCAQCGQEAAKYRCTRCHRTFGENCIRTFGEKAALILIERVYGKAGMTMGTAKIFDNQGRAFCPHCYGILLDQAQSTGSWQIQNAADADPSCILL